MLDQEAPVLFFLGKETRKSKKKKKKGAGIQKRGKNVNELIKYTIYQQNFAAKKTFIEWISKKISFNSRFPLFLLLWHFLCEIVVVSIQTWSWCKWLVLPFKEAVSPEPIVESTLVENVHSKSCVSVGKWIKTIILLFIRAAGNPRGDASALPAG